MLFPTGSERLAIIQQQVQRATSLIRQILDFSRRSVMEQINLDLLPFIKELEKLLARVLPEIIRLELSYQSEEYWVNADPTRLQQVFLNLAVNARDAMPEGGTLFFNLDRLQIQPGERPPYPSMHSGEWIRIEVKDTGEGIPPEKLPHIFEPFFTTKPAGEGTGANALGHPLNALAWLANERARQGKGLKAGEVVSTGVVTPFHYLKAGMRAVADSGALGQVTLDLAP